MTKYFDQCHYIHRALSTYYIIFRSKYCKVHCVLDRLVYLIGCVRAGPFVLGGTSRNMSLLIGLPVLSIATDVAALSMMHYSLRRQDKHGITRDAAPTRCAHVLIWPFIRVSQRG